MVAQPEGLFTGYAIESEDRQRLAATQTVPSLLMLGELPPRMDPRNSPLGKQGFLRVEDQGQIGSCQGQSLTDCGEFAHAFATGEVVQLSRMYAYIASQMESGIKGDNGSTLDGGSRAFQKGIPLEAVAPYGSSYPGWKFITQEMREVADYKLKTHSQMHSADEVKQFIGSGVGIVQIGIAWGNAMNPDGHGCIRSFAPGGGGHAIVFCGYVSDADIGQESGSGYWLLLKNSWSARWGVKGYAYVSPRACDQMLRNNNTVMYGRSDMESPRPRPVQFDFTKQSILG